MTILSKSTILNIYIRKEEEFSKMKRIQYLIFSNPSATRCAIFFLQQQQQKKKTAALFVVVDFQVILAYRI
jgi:hypothetical protein